VGARQRDGSHAHRTGPSVGQGVILLRVEIFFSALMVLIAVAVLWFSVYVVYRLYSDKR
jgi:hypothetical protein